ncbi:MAG: ExbD/TolR family protein [bacterium]
MGTSGTLIRLIDVVFILLFGFISISEISQKSQIELPKSTETPKSNPDREEVVFIGITRAGEYLVENENKMITDSQTLYYYLMNKINGKTPQENIRVRIRSNWDTPIKYTMAVTNICDDLNLPKSIDVLRLGGF